MAGISSFLASFGPLFSYSFFSSFKLCGIIFLISSLIVLVGLGNSLPSFLVASFLHCSTFSC